MKILAAAAQQKMELRILCKLTLLNNKIVIYSISFFSSPARQSRLLWVVERLLSNIFSKSYGLTSHFCTAHKLFWFSGDLLWLMNRSERGAMKYKNDQNDIPLFIYEIFEQILIDFYLGQSAWIIKNSIYVFLDFKFQKVIKTNQKLWCD